MLNHKSQVPLNSRLRAAASMVRRGARIADVGTDHAYLPIWLVQSNICPSAIASDIRPGPLERAKANVKNFHEEGRIQLRLGDGLSPVQEDEVDDILICGMGGEMIASILERASWTKNRDKNFILQPMSSPEDLRGYLRKNGFVIRREKAAVDAGRVYSAMQAVWEGKSAEKVSPAFDYLGRVMPKLSEEAMIYAQRQLQHLKNIRFGQIARGLNPEAAETEKIILAVAKEAGISKEDALADDRLKNKEMIPNGESK